MRCPKSFESPLPQAASSAASSEGHLRFSFERDVSSVDAPKMPSPRALSTDGSSDGSRRFSFKLGSESLFNSERDIRKGGNGGLVKSEQPPTAATFDASASPDTSPIPSLPASTVYTPSSRGTVSRGSSVRSIALSFVSNPSYDGGVENDRFDGGAATDASDWHRKDDTSDEAPEQLWQRQNRNQVYKRPILVEPAKSIVGSQGAELFPVIGTSSRLGRLSGSRRSSIPEGEFPSSDGTSSSRWTFVSGGSSVSDGFSNSSRSSISRGSPAMSQVKEVDSDWSSVILSSLASIRA